jgi:hypothetical protein
MRGNGIEEEVEICATNILNKTKCMSNYAKKLKKFVKTCSNTTSAICGPEDGNRSSFRNVAFSRIPDDGKSPKTQ